MNYIIHTPSATRLKQEITKYVSEKISDPSVFEGFRPTIDLIDAIISR